MHLCDRGLEGLKSEIHRTYIGSVEREERNVSLINIEKLEKALKVHIDELFLQFKQSIYYFVCTDIKL